MDLPRGHTVLSQDDRPIRAVRYISEPDGSWHEIGRSGIDRIAAYDEKGDLDWAPWIAVFSPTEIIVRIPAWAVAVHY